MFRQALEQGDLAALRRFWAERAPHLRQPDEVQAEIVMHRARTEAQSVSLKARAYSHRWLTERDLPSGLPDELKPSAERLFPRVVGAVGISVNFRSELLRPAIAEIRGAMEGAVNEAYADGREDPAFVTTRMNEARARTMRALFGNGGIS